MPETGLVEVWDLPARVFNSAILLAFLAALFTSGTGSPWHAAAGTTLLIVTSFRIVWGFVGSENARFASFVRSPGVVLQHLSRLLDGRGRRFLGHDPLTGCLLLLFLLLVPVIAATGLFLRHGLLTDGGAFGLHAMLADLGLVGLAAGVFMIIFESWRTGENLVAAMLTGRKRWQPGFADQGFAATESLPREVRDRIRSTEALALLALAAVLTSLWLPMAAGGVQSIYGPEWAAAPRDVDFETVDGSDVASPFSGDSDAVAFDQPRELRAGDAQNSSSEHGIVIAGSPPETPDPANPGFSDEPAVAELNPDAALPQSIPESRPPEVAATDEVVPGILTPDLDGDSQSADARRSSQRPGGSSGILGARDRRAVEQTVVADSSVDQISADQFPEVPLPANTQSNESVPAADATIAANTANEPSAGEAASGEGEPVFTETPAAPTGSELVPAPAAKGGFFDFLKRLRRKPDVGPFPGLAEILRDATIFSVGAAAAVQLTDQPIDAATASAELPIEPALSADQGAAEQGAVATPSERVPDANADSTDASGEGLAADANAVDGGADAAAAPDLVKRADTPLIAAPPKLANKRAKKLTPAPAVVVDAGVVDAGLAAATPDSSSVTGKKRGPQKLKGPRPPVAKAPKTTRRKPRDKNS